MWASAGATLIPMLVAAAPSGLWGWMKNTGMVRMAARSAWALSAFLALVPGQGAAGVGRQGA